MSIKKRTQEELLRYIKSHVSDGKLEESLIKMGESLGYSNATIHRTLKSLEEQGVIEVKPPEKPTHPNTIIYHGPTDEEDDILTQGAKLIEEIKAMQMKVEKFVQEAAAVIDSLQTKGEAEHTFSHIKEIMDMPDGKHQMVIIEKQSEHLV